MSYFVSLEISVLDVEKFYIFLNVDFKVFNPSYFLKN